MKKTLVLLAMICSTNAMAGLCQNGEGIEVTPDLVTVTGDCFYNSGTMTFTGFKKKGDNYVTVGTIAEFTPTKPGVPYSEETCNAIESELEAVLVRAKMAGVVVCVTGKNIVMTTKPVTDNCAQK